LVDAYLSFVGARLRLNSWLAIAYDLKVFFSVVTCEPVDVDTPAVFRFLEDQRAPRRGHKVVRLEDREQGRSARTIRRRLSSIAGLFDYLAIRGEVARNPVPRGSINRPHKQPGLRGRPLIRAPRTLPQTLTPIEADVFYAALRTWRDRAMIDAMLFGGLRRCEVLGLQLDDVQPGEHQVFIADGKGGHQRIVPVAPRFFTSLATYIDIERPGKPVTASVPSHERTSARLPSLSRRTGRDRRGRPWPSRHRTPDLPSAPPHLPHPATGSRYAVGSDTGPGRSPLDPVHPHLSAPVEFLAGRGIPQGTEAIDGDALQLLAPLTELDERRDR
jgi:integrase